MTESFVALTLRGLPGWMALPLDEAVDAASWAREKLTASAAGLEPVPSSIGLEAAADALRRAVLRARALWDGDIAAPISFAFQPDPLGPVLALLDAAAFPIEDEPLSPERVARMGSRDSTIVGPVDSSERTVPAGPATRYRATFGAFPDADEPTSVQAVGAVTYTIMPPELPGYVLLEGQWAIPALGDVIAAQIDEMAARLEVTSKQ